MSRRTPRVAGQSTDAADAVPLREALARLEEELAALARLARDLDTAIGAVAELTREAGAGTRRTLLEADRLRQTAEDLAMFTRALSAGVPADLHIRLDPERAPMQLGRLAARLHGQSLVEAPEAEDGDIQLF